MTKKIKIEATTIPTYTYQDTSDKNIKRFVDRNGNWTHYYIVNEKRLVPAVNHILRLGYPKGQRFQDWLLSVSKEEAKKKLETAGEEGTRTHAAIRDIIDGIQITMETKYPNDITGRNEVLTPGEWDNLIAFEAWCKQYKPQVIVQEDVLCNGYYAGTMDMLCTIEVPVGDKFIDKEFQGHRILVLVDWKTSSGVWPEYGLQVAAYADVAMAKYSDYVTKYGRPYTMIVRLGTRHKNGGYEVVFFSRDEQMENSKKFKAAIYIAGDDLEFSDSVQQIPTQFKIDVPREKKPTAKKPTKKVKKLKE